jgi:hypothetical protein
MWIYEKFYSWTDNNGSPEDELSRDQMLDDISLYWFTNAAASSARIYWEKQGSSFSGGKLTFCGRNRLPARYIVLQRAGPSRPIRISFTEMRLSTAAISPRSSSRTFLSKKCGPRFEN